MYPKLVDNILSQGKIKTMIKPHIDSVDFYGEDGERIIILWL